MSSIISSLFPSSRRVLVYDQGSIPDRGGRPGEVRTTIKKKQTAPQEPQALDSTPVVAPDLYETLLPHH